ncbi:hypothetical protein HPHPH28_0677 [Helicobacter pylori Hp H-28]|nr:hypothetical protein HPHPH28_0677 [Helicobacter pylori Hp H-28]
MITGSLIFKIVFLNPFSERNKGYFEIIPPTTKIPLKNALKNTA